MTRLAVVAEFTAHVRAIDVLAGAARTLVGAVFLWAAGSKLGNSEAFAANLAEFPATRVVLRRRPGYARAGAFTIISIEVVFAVLLVSGWLTILTSAAVVAFLAGSSLVMVRAIRRQETVRCGCFGATSQAPLGMHDVLRNVLLVAIVLLGATSSAVSIVPLVRGLVPWSAELTAIIISSQVATLLLLTYKGFELQKAKDDSREVQGGIASVWRGIPESRIIH